MSVERLRENGHFQVCSTQGEMQNKSSSELQEWRKLVCGGGLPSHKEKMTSEEE